MMENHHIKIIETTIQYLQFMISIFLIILSASGATFYYFWTTKLEKIKLKGLWSLVLPTGTVFIAIFFCLYIYSELLDALAIGSITDYMNRWSSWTEIILTVLLFIGIATLLYAFINLHKRSKE